MNKNFSSIRQFLPALLLTALGVMSIAFTAKAAARGCATKEVKILHYYGCQREDPCGNKLYGVKVRYGDRYYYAEIRSSIPCLWLKTNQRVNIVMCKDARTWDRVTYRDKTADIYQIVEVSGPFWQPPTFGLLNLW